MFRVSERNRFLAGYYLYNFVFSRIGRRFVERSLPQTAGAWEELRQRVTGHDTWLVVGNGPSLTADDLTALSGIPAVASNRINLLFEATAWRPTLYTIADPLTIYKLPKEHYKEFGLTLLPHSAAAMARTSRRLAWRLLPDEEGAARYLDGNVEISPLNGFISGATITVPNILLAMWAGARTIFVIGCDHFYKAENHKDGIRKTEHVGHQNHFHPDYRQPGEIVNAAPVEWMNRGYALMRKVADKHGVRIVNISRVTALDIFERGTVEDAVRFIASSGIPTSSEKAARV